VHACVPEAGFKMSQLVNASTSGTMSVEEQLRRERMRMFVTGVATYEWCVLPGGAEEFMMIPMNGSILLYEKTSEKVRCIYDGSAGPAIDPHMSPVVDSVAFIIGRDMYITHIDTAAIFAAEEGQTCRRHIRLTISGSTPGVSCGVADYVAQEEMDRYRGFWYSPDGSKIAYTKADESKVAQYDIPHFYDDDPLRKETHRYPFAGTGNPYVELAVLTVPQPSLEPASDLSSTAMDERAKEIEGSSISMQVSEKTWESLGINEYYLARVDWWPDGFVMAQVEDRRQQELQLLRLDPATGARHVLVRESCPDVWINLHDLWKPLDSRDIDKESSSNSFSFVWGSERSGFMQLYLYTYAVGSECATLVSELPIGGGGEWVVDQLVCVDTSRNRVFFSGNKGDPCSMQLFCAPLVDRQKTNPIVQVSRGDGWHRCSVSPRSNFYCDIYSSKDTPPCTNMRRLPFIPDWATASPAMDTEEEDLTKDDSHLLVDSSTLDDRYTNLKSAMRPPVIISVPSNDGVSLMCAVYVPPDATVDWSSGRPVIHGPGAKSYPCVVSVYGGPHVQRVQDTWTLTADLRAQRMCNKGFIVLKCDNRGSSRRGLAFEGAVKGDMGNLEVVDQSTAVAFLSTGFGANQTPLVDASRVGMMGWSYGGYMSAMALCRAPGVFRAAIAGAPVTHWDAYDTHYTERYMGIPQENVEGYERSAVMTHAAGITGRLMLIHGLIDENVHFRHTARLIQALNCQRTQYDLVLFPSERHSPHKKTDRIYLEDRIFQFFDAQLGADAANAVNGQGVCVGAEGATAGMEMQGQQAQARL
jgi:dipeptidyl-peptidase-4